MSHPKPEERIQSVTQKIGSLPKEGVLLEERFKKNVVL
jgi:predicted Zn-dependent protease